MTRGTAEKLAALAAYGTLLGIEDVAAQYLDHPTLMLVLELTTSAAGWVASVWPPGHSHNPSRTMYRVHRREAAPRYYRRRDVALVAAWQHAIAEVEKEETK